MGTRVEAPQPTKLCSASIMANGVKLLSSCHIHPHTQVTHVKNAHTHTHTCKGRGLKLGCQPGENFHSVIPARSRSLSTSRSETHTTTRASLPLFFFFCLSQKQNQKNLGNNKASGPHMFLFVFVSMTATSSFPSTQSLSSHLPALCPSSNTQ